MLWFMCFGLFAVSLAFPFGIPRGRSDLKNYRVQLVEYRRLPFQRHSICLPSPFLKQICLPSALQFFMPSRTQGTGKQRCLSIPIMRTYIVKICSPTDSISKEENLNKSLKEIIKEVETETETEKESLPDNTNIEVNGEEVEPEYFVKKESNVETKESLVEDKNRETKNKINRVFQEIEVSRENDIQSSERSPNNINFSDDNISITSNLV